MSDAWRRFVEDDDAWRAPSPLPGPVHTERLTVRTYERGDGPKLFEAIDAARPGLLPWMPWARTDHLVVDDSVHYVERARRAVTDPLCNDFPMGIFDRASGALLGGTGLHRIRPGLREGEIGYWIRGDRHGEGLCTEAIGALITSAVASAAEGGWGLRRVVIFHATGNVGSRRVCEKLGLRLECRMRAERYLGPEGEDGAPGYCDVLGFGVLADEWDPALRRARPDIAAPPS